MRTHTTYSELDITVFVIYVLILLALAVYMLLSAGRHTHNGRAHHGVDIDRQYPSTARRTNRRRSSTGADGAYVPVDTGPDADGGDGGDGGGGD